MTSGVGKGAVGGGGPTKTIKLKKLLPTALPVSTLLLLLSLSHLLRFVFAKMEGQRGEWEKPRKRVGLARCKKEQVRQKRA